MKRNSKKSLILGLVLAISTFVCFVTQASPNKNPKKPNVHYTVEDFIGEFGFEKDSSSKNAVLLRQRGGDAYLKVRAFDDISLEDAKSQFSDKIFSIHSLYREAFSPYPGALSNKISCPDEFKPRRISHALFDYYLLYANQRFNYGVCLWDLIEYKAVIYPLYCPRNRRYYQIELFVSKHKDISIYQESLVKLSCD